MSKTSDHIDYILKTGLQPLLKHEGFVKSSRNFRRPRTDCIQIINVQGSWTNFDGEGSFTANLGVYFPEAARIHGLSRVTERPSESDCMVHKRIGQLMPVNRDYWWKFNSKSDFEEIAEEVATNISRYGLPWLNEHSTIEGAIEYSLSINAPYWAAIFCLLLEDRNDAKRYLLEAMNKASHNPILQSSLEEMGRSNGLIP